MKSNQLIQLGTILQGKFGDERITPNVMGAYLSDNCEEDIKVKDIDAVMPDLLRIMGYGIASEQERRMAAIILLCNFMGSRRAFETVKKIEEHDLQWERSFKIHD